MEPALNVWAEGDDRDTTTPEAVLATLEALLLGDALAPASRTLLTEWMSRGSYTGAFLRAAAPADWAIADKSGAGDVTRTLVALVSPPGRRPWLVAIFLSEAEVDFATRNAAVTSLSAAVVAALRDAPVVP
jgi:Beta-lactamase class A